MIITGNGRTLGWWQYETKSNRSRTLYRQAISDQNRTTTHIQICRRRVCNDWVRSFFREASKNKPILRAYSIASGPYDDYLEFYSIKVQDGPLTSKLQHIQVGDELEVGEKPTGTLTLANVTLGGHLWLMATGTGIAPFISLLRDPEIYDIYDKITLCWTVRQVAELQAYNAMLEDLPIEYIPTVTQEDYIRRGRITHFIDNEDLWYGVNPTDDRVMLCGSMGFNEEMKARLESLSFVEGNTKQSATYVQEKAFVS